MYSINKVEAEILRKQIKDVIITRTMVKKSKRHNYFVEETKAVTETLQKIRN